MRAAASVASRGAAAAPLFRLERGAMINFGVPSLGVHVNGFTVPWLLSILLWPVGLLEATIVWAVNIP